MPKLKSDPHLEIAHVLFIDVVGYSKLLVNEQREVLQQLNQVVRKTPQFRKSEAAGKLIRIPVGDGMALAFFQTPEEPVQCAMEIARALKNHPHIRLRMGVHSGPVDQVKDVNDRVNITGVGINIAQRVMDCGDAGHILVSKRVADDLAQDSLWQPHLHELGEVDVKHGAKVAIFNVYTAELGNPHPPEKLGLLGRQARTREFGPGAKRGKSRLALIVVAVIIVGAIAVGVLFWSRRGGPTFAGTAALSASAVRGAANVPAMPEKSIAVLPFENLSDEKQNAYFADGVQDEILTDLSRIADLKVISRTSVMHYKSGVARNLREIGQQLGVAHVVEGSVQRSGNRVRVNAQLVDARTDRHLWGQTYDRDLADVFAIQSEIAKTIADQLQAKLSPAEKNAIERPPTSDIAAFDLYTRAKNLLLRAGSIAATERTNVLQAVDLLNQAVTRDPSFFDAYCWLAWAHDGFYILGYDHSSARLALADAAVQAASRLRPDAGETHLARGQNLYQGYLNYDGALAELEVARQTLPNDARVFLWRGLIERRQGRWEESIRDLERAIDLDPRNFFTLGQAAGSYQALRRYVEEKSVYDRVLAFEPNDAVTKVARALVELNSKADTRPLHQMIDSIGATNPAATPSIADAWLLCALAERDTAAAKNALIASGENPINLGAVDNVRFNPRFFEGVIARMTKDEDKAQSGFTAARVEQEKILEAQPNYGLAVCALGLIDAGLHRKEEALREGRRAVELLPVGKDALDGSGVIKYFAMIATWVGDKDLACEQLAIAIRSSSGLSYGQLKLLPFWDPLRGDPRFEKLVEESKKPVALK
jgi:TolB-like protein/class 3 adenylate cyclase/Tfp pilus assembly protein PilF